MPADTGLLVDAGDIVAAVGAVQFAISTDAYFAHDSIGIRATFRFGAKIIHTNRHAKFTVA